MYSQNSSVDVLQMRIAFIRQSSIGTSTDAGEFISLETAFVTARVTLNFGRFQVTDYLFRTRNILQHVVYQ